MSRAEEAQVSDVPISPLDPRRRDSTAQTIRRVSADAGDNRPRASKFVAPWPFLQALNLSLPLNTIASDVENMVLAKLRRHNDDRSEWNRELQEEALRVGWSKLDEWWEKYRLERPTAALAAHFVYCKAIDWINSDSAGRRHIQEKGGNLIRDSEWDRRDPLKQILGKQEARLRNELQKRMDVCVDELPPEHRQVMRRYHEPVNETAKTLKMSPSTVKRRRREAWAMLDTAMERQTEKLLRQDSDLNRWVGDTRWSVPASVPEPN